jgi:hypothetical protein
MAASGDWDPVVASAPGSSAGPRSWDPNPSAAPVSSAGPESWDPAPSAAPGSSAGPGSWEPDPSVEELPEVESTIWSIRGRGKESTMLIQVATIMRHQRWT